MKKYKSKLFVWKVFFIKKKKILSWKNKKIYQLDTKKAMRTKRTSFSGLIVLGNSESFLDVWFNVVET